MKSSVCFGLAFVSLLGMMITIISLATPHWLKISTVAYGGLWEACNIVVCTRIKYSEMPDYYKATQAFLFGAIICYFGGFVFGVLAGKKKSNGAYIIAFFTGAALCMVVAMSVYTNKSSLTSYGYSYILGWISFVLSVIFVIISALFAKVSDYSSL